MSLKALGLIEVRGYLGAIQAADSALKAANVTCIGCEKVKGGLVTVKLLGDIGSIKAAVEAGEKAAEGLGVLLSSHVIARLHEETAKLILPQEKPEVTSDAKDEDRKEAANGLAPIAAQIEEIENVIENPSDQYTTPEDKAEEASTSVADQSKESLPPTPALANNIRGRSLSDMKVVELRRLARKLKIKTMTFNEIKFAKKDKLILEIEKHMRGEESPWN